MPKHLDVRKIAAATDVTAARVSELLDEAHIEFQPIDVVDWSEAYPYQPQVQFRMAHTGSSILIEYAVTEQSVRAVAGQDNGRVWEDSCCEFFFAPADDALYYNVETNCAGFVHVGCGTGRGALRESLPNELIATVDRWSSLGHAPFSERVGECSWRMALVIPASLFNRHNLQSFDGLSGRANFYKCGDLQQTPHFLSWNKIEADKPNFHLPAFFGTLKFLSD